MIFMYDQAFLQKIQTVFANVLISPWEVLFEENARENLSRVKFPLVGITRGSWKPGPDGQNHADLFRGRYPNVDSSGSPFILPVLDIEIPYQLDVVSDQRDETDGLATEMAFFLKHKPSLAFNLLKPYPITILDSEFRLDDVTDNSEIGSFIDKGRIWRTTFELTLRNAKLYQSRRIHLVEEILISLMDNSAGSLMLDIYKVSTAPQDLYITPGPGSASLFWDTVPGASLYHVKRSLVSGGPYTTVISLSSNHVVDSTVTSGLTYHYVVSAVSGDTETANSVEASVLIS